MTRCVGLWRGLWGRQCERKASPGMLYCSKHLNVPQRGAVQCLGTTWKGKRCKLATRVGEEYCSTHTPFPKTVKMFFIQRKLKPAERLANGGYRKHPYPKLFHTRGAAYFWLQDNWNDKIMKCAPGKKLKSASIESVSVPNKGVYLKQRRVDFMFPANG